MTPREITGLVLLLVAFSLAPFGYWLSFKWTLFALLFGIPGSILFFTARAARRFGQQEPGAADTHPSKDLKGFHGAPLFDSHDDD